MISLPPVPGRDSIRRDLIFHYIMSSRFLSSKSSSDGPNLKGTSDQSTVT